jgi:hypothetical protein
MLQVCEAIRRHEHWRSFWFRPFGFIVGMFLFGFRRGYVCHLVGVLHGRGVCEELRLLLVI